MLRQTKQLTLRLSIKWESQYLPRKIRPTVSLDNELKLQNKMHEWKMDFHESDLSSNPSYRMQHFMSGSSNYGANDLNDVECVQNNMKQF